MRVQVVWVRQGVRTVRVRLVSPEEDGMSEVRHRGSEMRVQVVKIRVRDYLGCLDQTQHNKQKKNYIKALPRTSGKKWPCVPPLCEVPSDLLDTITGVISLTPHTRPDYPGCC